MITSARTKERVAKRHLGREGYFTETRNRAGETESFCVEKTKVLCRRDGLCMVGEKHHVLARIDNEIFACRHTKRLREWHKTQKLFSEAIEAPKEERRKTEQEKSDEFKWKFVRWADMNGLFESKSL